MKCKFCGLEIVPAIESEGKLFVSGFLNQQSKEAGFCGWSCHARNDEEENKIKIAEELDRQNKIENLRISKSSDFYISKEWRELRYRVLVKYGRKCGACAASGDDVEIHVDHIIPRSKRPDLSLVESNLQILCIDCNLGKSNYSQEDFRRL